MGWIDQWLRHEALKAGGKDLGMHQWLCHEALKAGGKDLGMDRSVAPP